MGQETRRGPGAESPAPPQRDSVFALMGERAHRLLAALLNTLLLVLPLLLAALLLGGALAAEVALVAALMAAVLVLKLLQRRGRMELVLVGLVLGLVVFGAAVGAAFGSVRTVGMLALVGAVVVAGIFVGRRALVGTVLACALVLGGLIVAQNRGWLREPQYEVGLLHWVVYVAVLSAIAANIWFVRSIMLDAVRRARAGEAWLATVWRGTPTALVTTSLHDGRVLATNDAYERIFGWRPQQTIGRTAVELGVWAEPADRENFVQRIGQEGRVEIAHARMRRASGEVFDARVEGEAVDSEGGRRLVTAITDLSAEMQARRALVLSEARFRRLFEGSPAATVLFTLEQRIVDCNDAFVRLVGRERAAIVGRSVLELGLWHDAGEREDAWQRWQRGDAVRGLPATWLGGSGAALQCLLDSSAIEVEGSSAILVHATDISEELRLRAAQRASEERFTKAFHSSPIGMTITRLSDGRYLEANAADEATLGYTRSELLDTTTTRAGAWRDAADRERFVALLKSQGRVLDYPSRMRGKWGQDVDARIYAELIELDGEPCVLASTLNVTEQLREEQLVLEAARGVSAEIGETFFQRLAEHLVRATGSDRAIIGELIDGGRRVRSVARYTAGAAGAQLVYDLEGSPCEEVLARRDLVIWESGVAERFPHDEPLVQAGVQGYIGAPLFGVDGAVLGIMNALSTQPLVPRPQLTAVFRIFATRAQSELARLQREREIVALNETLELRVRERTAQLEVVNAELEAVNTELEAFSYSASHDLRAPLRAIDGFSALLEERHAGQLPAEALAHLQRVRNGARQMGRIIDDLLALARVGRVELRPTQVDLSQLAQAVASELARSQPDRRVQWLIESDLHATADRGLVHIALTNLLGNAWKYSSRREQAVISLAAVRRVAGRIELRVSDNGAGFDMAYAAKLFQPFRRLHAQHEFEGTGIGLATVKRVIERHGGQVRGEGRAGDGASFDFDLPAGDGQP